MTGNKRLALLVVATFALAALAPMVDAGHQADPPPTAEIISTTPTSPMQALSVGDDLETVIDVVTHIDGMERVTIRALDAFTVNQSGTSGPEDYTMNPGDDDVVFTGMDSGTAIKTFTVAWTATADIPASASYQELSFEVTVNHVTTPPNPPTSPRAVDAEDRPIVDAQPPSTTATVAPVSPDGDNGWYTAQPEISLIVTDNVDASPTIEYRIDGGTWTEYVAPFTVPEGQGVTVEARATDEAGNVEAPAIDVGTFDVDTTNPVVSVSGIPSTPVNVAPELDVTVDEDHPSSTECEIQHQDAGTPTDEGDCSTAPWTPTVGPDGTYTVRVKHTDQAGNEAVTTDTFALDATDPIVTITGLPDDPVDSPPTLTVTIDETHKAATTCSVNGVDETPADCEGTWTPSVDGDGTYGLTVEHTDGAGNTDEATGSFVLDTTDPVVTIDGLPAGPVATAPELTVTIAEDHPGTTTCLVNDAEETPADCEGTWTPTVAGDGTYALEVSHTDEAGNQIVETGSFVLDSTDPVVTITGLPSDPVDSAPTLTVTLDEDNPHETICSIDGAPVGDCTGSWDLASEDAIDGDGTYELKVVHTDAAGNAASDSGSFTLDTSGPTVSLTRTTLTDAGAVVSEAPSFDVSVEDTNPGTTTCSVNGADVGDCTGTWTPSTSSGDGLYELTVEHTDAAGNTDEATASFVLDTTDPILTLEAPTDRSTFRGGLPVRGSVDEANLDQVTIILDGGQPRVIETDDAGSFDTRIDLVSGKYTVVVTATDAGGRSTSSAELNVQIDANPPRRTSGFSSDSGSSDDSSSSSDITDSSPDPAGIELAARSGWITEAPFTPSVSADGAYEWRLGDGAWRVAPITVPEGVHDVSARLVGSSETVERTYRVDATPPTLDISLSPDPAGAISSEPVTVLADASDAISGVEQVDVRVDDGPWQPLDGFVLDGEVDHELTVRAMDVAGNAAEATTSVRVDTVGPLIEAPDLLALGQELVLTVTDGLSGVDQVVLTGPDGLDLEASPRADQAWIVEDVAGLAGLDEVTVTATDGVGHSSSLVLPVGLPDTDDVEEDEALEELEADDPEATFNIHSIVVSPTDPEPSQTVRVTAIASGVASGRLLLVDADGERIDIGAFTVEDGKLTGEGEAPGPGSYDVVFELVTVDGESVEHADGSIVVEGDESQGVPGAGPAVAVLLLAGLGALVQVRRH